MWPLPGEMTEEEEEEGLGEGAEVGVLPVGAEVSDLFLSEQVYFTSFVCALHVAGGRGGGGRGGGRGGGGDGTPSKTLFVRNLNYETEPSSLQEIFADANDVFLPKDRETQERRGYV